VKLAIRVVDDGVEIDVPDESPRGALRIESAPGWLVRLVIDDRTLAWARAEPWRSRFAWASMPCTSLAVVEPIRASEARATPPIAWPRAMAERLVRSPRTWLRAGTWTVRTEPVSGLVDALDARAAFVERHGVNGSGRVIALRPPSQPENARVKSYRKHARDGTLPPVLLGWVSVIDAYVVLDGHDRLLAARLEHVVPDALVLAGVREDRERWPDIDRDRVRREAGATYERVFAAEPRLSDRARVQANARLTGAWSDWAQRRTWTPATHRADLHARLTRELGDVPDDVRALLLAP
jgi:hypothetical protein